MRPIAIWVALFVCFFARAADALQCSVSATPLAFGTYDPVSGPAAQSSGTLTVSCSNGPNASYTIALNTGLSGSYFPRQMASGADRLPYQLFTDPAHTLVWGDGSAGTSTLSDRMVIPPPRSRPVTRNYTIYGQIPGRLPVSPGSYTDVVTVTVTY